jgi:hypothetical protein
LTGVEVVGADVAPVAVDVVCGVLAVELVPVELLVVPVPVLAVLVVPEVVPDVVDELAGAELDELPEEPQPARAIAAVKTAGSAERMGRIERGTVATAERRCAAVAAPASGDDRYGSAERMRSCA